MLNRLKEKGYKRVAGGTVGGGRAACLGKGERREEEEGRRAAGEAEGTAFAVTKCEALHALIPVHKSHRQIKPST